MSNLEFDGESDMYNYQKLNDCYISLHDCRADKMNYKNGTLSFIFPEGFWVTAQHSENKSDDIVRTDLSQVDFQIINEEIDGVQIYIFRKNANGKVVREDWEPENFINAVNSGDFEVEFITQYRSFQSILYKCWVWFDKKPYHYECEIILHTENVTFSWNQLRYNCIW